MFSLGIQSSFCDPVIPIVDNNDLLSQFSNASLFTVFLRPLCLVPSFYCRFNLALSPSAIYAHTLACRLHTCLQKDLANWFT